MEKETIEEEKKAGDIREVQTQEFSEGNVDFMIEDYRNDMGAIIEGTLYDVMRDSGGISNLFYIKKVNGHVEIGPVKKLEIIY